MFVDLKKEGFFTFLSPSCLWYTLFHSGQCNVNAVGCVKVLQKYIIFSNVPIQKFIRMSALPVHGDES